MDSALKILEEMLEPLMSSLEEFAQRHELTMKYDKRTSHMLFKHQDKVIAVTMKDLITNLAIEVSDKRPANSADEASVLAKALAKTFISLICVVMNAIEHPNLQSMLAQFEREYDGKAIIVENINDNTRD